MIAAFGNGILADDRTIDRTKLGPIVFADPAALKRLNSILHPKMYARMREMIDAMRAAGEARPIVVEAAILIEANWLPLFNEVWLIAAAKERVIDRVERDRGLARVQVEARIKAQLSDDERRKHAAIVITNDSTIDDLRATLAATWRAALERNRKEEATR
jgi:dephospho-CoA kinase